MEVLTALLFGICGLVFLLVAFRSKRRRPPGPTRLPLVGSFFSMQLPVNDELRKHAALYGEVSCFKLGSNKLTVVLNSYRAVKEAFITQADVFSGRSRHYFSTNVFGNSGLVMNDGETWKKHRRFTLKTLRDFGLGRNICEEIIIKESEELCDLLQQKSKGGIAIDVHKSIATCVSNVICQLIFSQRLASEDEFFEKKLTLVSQITQHVGKQTFLSAVVIPLISKLFPSFMNNHASYQRAKSIITSLLDYCQKIIDEKSKNYNPADEPRDYVEAYYSERHKLSEAEASEFGDQRLTVSIFDLFIAGTDTTTNSLRWIIFALSRDFELQKRVHEQVRKVLGHRSARMSDKKDLGVVEALLEECQRFHVLVPSGVIHRLVADTNLLGFDLPKDCNVISNIRQVHLDPQLFPNPHTFSIDRFLDQNGSFKPSEFIIPFSMGKRSCLGESLARMELFLFTCALIQRFQFSLSLEDVSRQDEIIKGTEGTVCAPSDYKVVIAIREDFKN